MGLIFLYWNKDNQIMLYHFWAGRDTYDTVFIRSKPFMDHLPVIVCKSFGLSECINLSRIMPQSREDFTESQMPYQSCLSPLSCA